MTTADNFTVTPDAAAAVADQGCAWFNGEGEVWPDLDEAVDPDGWYPGKAGA